MMNKKTIGIFLLGWLFSIIWSPAHLTNMFKAKSA
jgi:hypothetical protein